MSISSTAPNLWQQLWWRWRPVRSGEIVCPGFGDLPSELSDETRAFVRDSYPHNHTYEPVAGALVAHRKLARRFSRLAPHYPARMRSLLDLSCSKGFFVFQAAAQAHCDRALGIDLDPQCLAVCETLRDCFERRSHVRFAGLTLTELAARIDEFGGPFQTVMLVNTYQYLVFGSDVAPAVSRCHKEIFALLRRVCSGRLIFHNRLSFADLQQSTQTQSEELAESRDYTPEAIGKAAEAHFHVRRLEPWSRRPVWLLDAR